MARAISKMIGNSPRLDMRPPPREFPVAPRRMLYLCGLVAGCTTAMPGLALTLGGVTEQSQLGQPFRMVVPVVTQATEELSGECVKLVPSRTKNGDDIPEVAWANVAMEQVGPSTRLVVSSRRRKRGDAQRIEARR